MIDCPGNVIQWILLRRHAAMHRNILLLACNCACGVRSDKRASVLSCHARRSSRTGGAGFNRAPSIALCPIEGQFDRKISVIDQAHNRGHQTQHDQAEFKLEAFEYGVRGLARLQAEARSSDAAFVGSRLTSQHSTRPVGLCLVDHQPLLNGRLRRPSSVRKACDSSDDELCVQRRVVVLRMPILRQIRMFVRAVRRQTIVN